MKTSSYKKRHWTNDCRCRYCKKYLPYKYATVDHVVPKSKGGKDEPANYCFACVECNSKKSNRILEGEELEAFSKNSRKGYKTWLSYGGKNLDEFERLKKKGIYLRPEFVGTGII